MMGLELVLKIERMLGGILRDFREINKIKDRSTQNRICHEGYRSFSNK